jgi:hypothetical protein
MAFVHHTMLTAENLRGLPSKQLHTNVEPHYSPRSRAAPLRGVGGLVGVYSRPVIGGAPFGPLSGFRYWGLGSWKARARKIQSPPTEGGGQKKR